MIDIALCNSAIPLRVCRNHLVCFFISRFITDNVIKADLLIIFVNITGGAVDVNTNYQKFYCRLLNNDNII